MLSDQLLHFVQVFVLVVFRVAGMMLFTPLFGSSRIPRRVRTLLCVAIAACLVPTVERPANLPDNTWQLALGIGGEMMFGLATGMILSFTFIAAQWAGEMIGQQMGLNLSEVFDPQFGAQGSVVGEMYFMLTLVIFLAVNGHHAVILGIRESFASLPLLAAAIDMDLLDLLVGLLFGATNLAIQLAAPMLLTMLVLDLALGLLGKTMPQLNVMTAGMSMRSGVGMVVLIVGLALSSRVIEQAMLGCIESFFDACLTGIGVSHG
jgi:flagellar biosynthetic protein FliR